MLQEQAQTVLSVSQLKKRIKDKLIIKGISFEVGSGEVFGFLGPNGAGKTTTIRMLVGLIRPTEGEIVICGIPLRKNPNEALRHIGCIVENPEMYPYLTGWENLEHFARMLPGVGRDRIQEVVGIVGLDKRIHDKVKTYSLGMRQRLGIAQALLGRPKLLILDEPTNGLDPQGIKEMREFIRGLAADGLSVFVSSHLLSEIQLMCDRVAIISHGEVIAVGQVDQLLQEAETRIEWRVSSGEKAAAIISEYSTIPVEISTDAAVRTDEAAVSTIRSKVDPVRVPDVAEALLTAGIRLYGIETKTPTLEDLFLRLTEGGTIQ